MTRRQAKYGQPAVYNATPPTLNDGDSVALNTDVNGNLKTVSGGSGASSNQVQGTAADNAAAVGNPIRNGAVYNSSAQVYQTGDIADLQTDVAGNLKVTGGSATGSAAPATAILVGASDGTNLAALRTGIASDGFSATAALATQMNVYNGTNLDRARTIINATNSTGTGIIATGIVAQLDDTSPTSITENQFGNVRMSADRSLLMTERSVSSSVTSVAGSATSVSLLALNNARKGATITNDSSAVLYIKLGATASTSSYTVTLAGSAGAPFTSYEVPFGYVGAIDGIWASATGNARITEVS